MAQHVAAIARTNPAQAEAVQSKLLDLLDAGDQSRFTEDLSKISSQAVGADKRLAGLGDGNAATTAPTGTGVREKADALLKDATSQTGGLFSTATEQVNTAELAYQIETLAVGDPTLARAVRADLSARLAPDNAADLDRMLSGDVGFGEAIGTAISHPVDGMEGAGKGLANGFLSVGDLLARGSTYQAAAEQQQMAGWQGLLGNEDAARQHSDLAEGLNDVAGKPMVPTIPYDNVAQAGGSDIETIAEVALAGKGLVAGTAKALARTTVKLADELPILVRTTSDDLVAFRSKLGGPTRRQSP